jgi:hypothetical protein
MRFDVVLEVCGACSPCDEPVDSPCRSRSRSLVSLLPPRPSAVAGRALEGFRFPSAHRFPREPPQQTSSPSLLFRAVPFALVFRPSLLDSSAHIATRALRDVPFAPPSTCPCSVYSRDGGLPSLRPRGFHPRSPVPPLWFLTTSTVSSAARVAGLLHPAADPGVHRVSAQCTWSKTRSLQRFPAMQVRTPRRNPRRQPRHIAVSVAPLPFSPDRRLVSTGSIAGTGSFEVGGPGASASRPCSVVESGVGRLPLPACVTRSFLGFVPLQGPSRQSEILSPAVV